MQRERDPKVVEEFRRRRKRQLWLAAFLIAGLISLTWLMERQGQSEKARGAIVITIVLAALAYSWRNWRCPACNGYLGKSAFLSFCPRCGIPLR